jgi:lipopolysaccharide biosynthesis glycosyltransferase
MEPCRVEDLLGWPAALAMLAFGSLSLYSNWKKVWKEHSQPCLIPFGITVCSHDLNRVTVAYFFTMSFTERVAVSMFSILLYSVPTHFYKIYAICVTPNTTCPSLLSTVQLHYLSNSELVFLSFPVDLPLRLDQEQRFSKATLGRFFLPLLVPESPVLYLDVDTLANRDIFPFFELPFSSSVYFYANLCFNLNTRQLQKHLMRMQFDRKFYYNAGVLLLNTHVLRAVNFTRKTVETLIAKVNHLPYPDQDVMNMLFGRSRVRLFPDFRYHCQPHTMGRPECIVLHNHRPPTLNFMIKQFSTCFGHNVTFKTL